MNEYGLKRKIAAMLCAVMLCVCAVPGVLAEDSQRSQEIATDGQANMMTKIKVEAVAVGNTIEVTASNIANPVIKVRLDQEDYVNMQGTKHVFYNVSAGIHTVQVAYNAQDFEKYASDLVQVEVSAGVSGDTYGVNLFTTSTEEDDVVKRFT
ncbi:MAG: hypothetical protein Q4F18_05260, partial [Clostridia bacterium]|nr:hypothetical protein [Clostridia bacterium]